MARRFKKRYTRPLLHPEKKKKIARLSFAASLSVLGVWVGLVVFAQIANFLLKPAHIDTSPPPFPVSVDQQEKVIDEDPTVDIYLTQYIVTESIVNAETKISWWKRIYYKLTQQEWYQQLAAPLSRSVVVWPGNRHEEVAESFGKILRWSDEEKVQFVQRVTNERPVFTEGKFYPGRYTVHKDATPEEVADEVLKRFNNQIVARYSPDVEKRVPLEDALIIASLLEREAYDFEDMRIISGIIWNRLFVGQKLQLDATLQYAKGSMPTGPWWPVPLPSDKYLDSPYNTYQNHGLPPTPIANPSLDSVLAALNPKQTDCMFYFHDANAGFHCSVTYEEHVRKIRQYY